LGREHAYRDPCRQIVSMAGEGAIQAEASVELVQELVHVRARRLGDRGRAIADGRAAAALFTLHDFGARDLTLALSLLGASDHMGVRDAVHAATALNRGIDAILSPDRDFDGIAGLERVDPADERAVEALGA
jgi:hypothetical protein